MTEQNGSNRQRPLFALGDTVATPGALRALIEAGQTPEEFILRHVTGDWGSLPAEDIRENERARKPCLRLFSSYKLNTSVKLWIISEHDRSYTTLLLPQDY